MSNKFEVGSWVQHADPESEHFGRIGLVIQRTSEGIPSIECAKVRFKEGAQLLIDLHYLRLAKVKKVRQAVAWNVDKTRSVVLGKLKEFTLSDRLMLSQPPVWQVRGWFNLENSFLFGEFTSKEEAQEFLQTIHEMY